MKDLKEFMNDLSINKSLAKKINNAKSTKEVTEIAADNGYSFDENDLKLVKNVMKELYGEYIYLATYRQDNINWVLFYKFSTIYRNKKLSGAYEDFVASDLMANLAYGTHVLPYESKLAKALLTAIKYSYPNSHGYRDGDYFIIEKQ